MTTPKLGDVALISGRLFTAVEYLPGRYPVPNEVLGYWNDNAEHMCRIRMDAWLRAQAYNEKAKQNVADHMRTMGIHLGQTYMPARNNRRAGPALYKVTAFHGYDKLQLDDGRVVSPRQWNAWRERTRLRAKSG